MKKILLGVVGGLVGVYLLSLLYIALHVYDNTAHPSDAIVILGARTTYKNMVNPCLRARVTQGVALYKAHFASTLIMSGGNDIFDSHNQAKLMANIALDEGVPKKAILLETKSATTYENLFYTKKILKDQRLDSVIIVSDPYHLPRAALIAHTLHLSYTVAPAVNSPCWSKHTFLGIDYFRDGFALLFYIISGRINFFS